MKNQVKTSYSLTLVIVLLPILSIYKSPLRGVDLGSLVLILAFIYSVYKNKTITLQFPREWSIYLFLVIISILVIYPFSLKNQSFTYVFLRTSKYVLYMVIGIYSATNGVFHLPFGLLVYKVVGIVSVSYIYLQSFLFRFFSINFIGVIPELLFLQSYTDRFVDFITSNRPTSFFLEPGHFFDYIMFLLIIALFKNRSPNLIDVLFAIFISVGLVLSTSGQAILFVLFIWFYFLVKILKRKTVSSVLVLISLLFCIPILFFQDSVAIFYQNNLERVFNLEATGGNAIIARAEGFNDFLSLPILSKFIGVGYANVPNHFFSSVSFSLYTLGIIGLIFILNIYYKSYKGSTELYIKLLVLALLIVSLGNTSFMSVSSIFYFSFIYSKNSECKLISTEKHYQTFRK